MLEGDQTARLEGMELSKQEEIRIVGVMQIPHAAPASQEPHSFGQSSIPNRNLVVTLISLEPAGIAPPIVLLLDYEQLQKNFEELKQQNDELRMNNEDIMRKL